MKNTYVWILLCGSALTLWPLGSIADELKKWPLRNGDFSTFALSGAPDEPFLETGRAETYEKYLRRCRPADWEPVTLSGTHRFGKAEAERPYPPLPYHVFALLNQPSAAVIETIQTGRAAYVQELDLMKGTYRLRVEATGTAGAKAQLTFATPDGESHSEIVLAGPSWQATRLDVSAPGGKVRIGLYADAAAGQIVQFRNARLDILSLAASPVPLDDGQQIAGIVLPEEPTLAEGYAGYELQRYIFRMTGMVPGVRGRDETAEGRWIRLGRAADDTCMGKLRALPDDAYIVEVGGGDMVLAGKTGSGTLYAVYDYLKQQGCRWTVPGDEGEIVPRRQSLVPGGSKIEIPDYDCRGYHVLTQDYFLRPNGEEGWVAINLDDYLDWSLRNRMNGIRFCGIRSYDFGAHRSHGWIQLSNHSFNSVVAPHEEYFEDHPEWYPLLRGERIPKSHHKPFFPNQLCLSNASLRDYTVDLVIAFFKANPRMRTFPLIPMDGASLWCECEPCKELDPPGVDWSLHYDEGHVVGVTDRYVHFANEIAARVAEVYPEKQILIQAYSYTLRPPVRERVHPNVTVRFANLSRPGVGPLGKSILDVGDPMWAVWRRQLDGWTRAGAHLSHYNYMDWSNPDVSLFWCFSLNDVARNLHRVYRVRKLFGETEPNQRISPMMFHVLAETLWDVDSDYREVIRDVCDHYYGPMADDMFAYHMTMDRALIASTAWKRWKAKEGRLWGEGYRNIQHVDIPLEVLEQGRVDLAALSERVQRDRVLARRIAHARLGHAFLTYLRALNEPDDTLDTGKIAEEAIKQVNGLRSEFGIMIKRFSAEKLPGP